MTKSDNIQNVHLYKLVNNNNWKSFDILLFYLGIISPALFVWTIYYKIYDHIIIMNKMNLHILHNILGNTKVWLH